MPPAGLWVRLGEEAPLIVIGVPSTAWLSLRKVTRASLRRAADKLLDGAEVGVLLGERPTLPAVKRPPGRRRAAIVVTAAAGVAPAVVRETRDSGVGRARGLGVR